MARERDKVRGFFRRWLKPKRLSSDWWIAWFVGLIVFGLLAIAGVYYSCVTML